MLGAEILSVRKGTSQLFQEEFGWLPNVEICIVVVRKINDFVPFLQLSFPTFKYNECDISKFRGNGPESLEGSQVSPFNEFGIVEMAAFGHHSQRHWWLPQYSQVVRGYRGALCDCSGTVVTVLLTKPAVTGLALKHFP